MAQDYCADAQAIAAELALSGNVERADQITDAIESGSMATEILMGLRWHLGQAISKDEIADESLKRRIESLRDQIGRVLEP